MIDEEVWRAAYRYVRRLPGSDADLVQECLYRFFRDKGELCAFGNAEKMSMLEYYRDILAYSRRIVQPTTRIGPAGGDPNRSLERPPGNRLGAVARFWFSRKTYTQVLEPILRDLLDEYFEALDEGKTGKARWVKLRGIYAFWSAVLAQVPVSLLRLLHLLWKAAG